MKRSACLHGAPLYSKMMQHISYRPIRMVYRRDEFVSDVRCSVQEAPPALCVRLGPSSTRPQVNRTGHDFSNASDEWHSPCYSPGRSTVFNYFNGALRTQEEIFINSPRGCRLEYFLLRGCWAFNSIGESVSCGRKQQMYAM